jgi:hypothetical protein
MIKTGDHVQYSGGRIRLQAENIHDLYIEYIMTHPGELMLVDNGMFVVEYIALPPFPLTIRFPENCFDPDFSDRVISPQKKQLQDVVGL